MSTFTGPEFNYPFDSLILLRITAQNEKGTSLTPSSEITDGAKAKLVPQQMDYAGITRGSLTSQY